VWFLWGEIQTQWVASAMGLIGLDYDRVENEAGRHEIDLNRCMWRKIKALERCVLRSQGGGSDGPESRDNGDEESPKGIGGD